MQDYLAVREGALFLPTWFVAMRYHASSTPNVIRDATLSSASMGDLLSVRLAL